MDSTPGTESSAGEHTVERPAGQWIGFGVALLVLVAGGYYVAWTASYLFAVVSNGESALAAWLPVGGWLAAIVAALLGAAIAYRVRRSPGPGMAYAGGIYGAALFAGLLFTLA